MKKYIVFLILVFMLMLSSVLTAAEPGDRFTNRQIDNLITGIKAENNGLMRSSVYFAGKYKITQATSVLLEVFEKETEPSNIILIALAIYEIGDRDAMMKVIDTANNTQDIKIKNMLSAIALQYLAESGMQYVLR